MFRNRGNVECERPAKPRRNGLGSSGAELPTRRKQRSVRASSQREQRSAGGMEREKVAHHSLCKDFGRRLSFSWRSLRVQIYLEVGQQGQSERSMHDHSIHRSQSRVSSGDMRNCGGPSQCDGVSHKASGGTVRLTDLEEHQLPAFPYKD